MVIKVDFDLIMSITAHNIYRLLARELERYENISDQTIYEEFIRNAGEVDITEDLYLLAICLLRLLNRSGPEKLQQYWEGPEDILKLLQEVTDLSTRFLPDRVRGTIQKWVQARS